MPSVNAVLLFVGNPSLAIEHFVESLNTRLAPLDIQAEEISPVSGSKISFLAAGVTVSVSCVSTPMSADQFKDSLKSPLSKPSIGLLAETLSRHTRHMIVSVSENDPGSVIQASFLTRLQLAHTTTCLLAEWHMPAAVHWQQSNQLLTGAQYLQLSKDTAPWALFARARKISSGNHDEFVPTHGVQLDEAEEFIGRPIQFRQTQLSFNKIHAAALSFLRHAVETGAPIPHGHTFGPKGGHIFRVNYVDAYDEMPQGMYELSVVQSDADTALGDPARSSRAIQIDAGTTLPNPDEELDPKNRTRSMAISYFMLVIMPPVGAVLLMSNAVFGSNVWRTGLVALGSVAIAVSVGTYAFMNSGHETTALLDNEVIQSSVLAE